VAAYPYRFRLAEARECAALPDIERAAAQAFREYAHITGLTDAQLDRTNSIEDFAAAQKAGLLWVVANDAPVGFALLREFDDALHLHEFDVHPAHARRGLGAQLLRHVCEHARKSGAVALTLTTYRDVPWNAPYYERLGFRIVPESEWTPALRQIRDEERRNGWRFEARVAMRLDLLSRE
jgi:GNAT superfamily N-acetyltransferase